MSTTAPFGRGICPTPFFQEELFSNSTGFIPGRLCLPVGRVHCCLPCPQTDWVYADNFDTITQAASWINVGGLACSLFLLASFAALPIEKTHRHYLSICLAVATMLMEMGFIIPLAAKPEQCANAITPNDMYSSRTCAISGAFLMAGGWCAVMWIFLRALALHLQICWQVVIGKAFMFGAFASGWGIPAVAVAVAFVLSGVSFRFGDTCHINHTNSLADLWIPLLVFAGMTVIVQFATFGYCIKVYLASLSDSSSTSNSLPSYTHSLGSMSRRQAYRRVRRVIELQWRGIAIVILIIADVVFFAIVFVFLDNNEEAVVKDPTRATPWVNCLLLSKGDKNKCLSLASPLIVNEATVMAVLILLSCNGIWLLLLLGRFSMFTGWYELIKEAVNPNREFVSKDAKTFAKDPRSYDLLSKDMASRMTPDVSRTTPDVSRTTSDVPLTPLSPASKAASGGRSGTPDYFGREAKYKNPPSSFSSPRAPQGRSWSPTSPVTPPPNARIDPLAMNKI